MAGEKAGRRGRPTRAEASEKALAGVDADKIDPRAILERIAADTSAPATARVAACKALLAQPEQDPEAGRDPVTDLALKLLKRGN